MQTTLARTVISVIVVSFLFVNCKKSNDSAYFVKFKVDGNWITWNKAVGEIGPDLADDSYTNFGLTATSDDEKNMLDISLQVADTEMPTGTYSSDNYTIFFFYLTNINSANAEHYREEAVNGRPDPHFTITLTSVTDDKIRGTFTGNYLVEMNSGEIVEITEGEFYLPDIYQ